MKRLYRSRKNKVIAGVCGGIAEYFETDPVLIRLIAVLFFFTGGATLIVYIVALIIIPQEPWDAVKEGAMAQGQNEAPAPQAGTGSRDHVGPLIVGILLIMFGLHFLLRNIPFFPFLQRYYWWFWTGGWHFFWPSVLIAIGLLIIFRGVRK